MADVAKQATMMAPPVDSQEDTLSIIEGGPGDGVLQRLKLAQPLSHAALDRNAAILAMICWFPLAFLSAIEGLAISGITIPFVEDLAVHVRCLIAVPILVLAEESIGQKLRATARHFVTSGLVRAEDRKRFAQIIAATIRFRDSRVVAPILIAVVLLFCWATIDYRAGANAGTWYLPRAGGNLSIAGYWYALVAMPIFHFLFLRWIYRVTVWARFIKEVAKLDLRLTPAHPDGAGGLAFLGKAVPPLGSILFALSAVLSAGIASRVLFGAASLYPFLPPYAAVMVLLLLYFVSPLLLFAPKLHKVKEGGLYQYGTLATAYTMLFDKKWIGGGAPKDEPLLGSADIQSLADLANSYQVVAGMRIVPVTRVNLGMLAIPAVVPAIPLAATVMPIADIAKDLLKLLA